LLPPQSKLRPHGIIQCQASCLPTSEASFAFEDAVRGRRPTNEDDRVRNTPFHGSPICEAGSTRRGAAASEDGCMEVDRHQRTSVKYLYSAGDVVNGLDQISVCIGQAAIAAVAIRNDLCDEQQMLSTAPLKECSALS
jgi:hypothetical protein